MPSKCTHTYKKGKVLFIEFDNGWTIISKLGMTEWWFSNLKEFGEPGVLLTEINKLAPDITNSISFSSNIKKRINKLVNKKPNELIEDVIIDQKLIFSGIGNYLKSEILYLSKISPLRPIKNIDMDMWKLIFKCSRKIVKKMYKILVNKTSDEYMDSMYVYQKTEDLYGNKIKTHTSKTGRTSFYVPSIQK